MLLSTDKHPHGFSDSLTWLCSQRINKLSLLYTVFICITYYIFTIIPLSSPDVGHRSLGHTWFIIYKKPAISILITLVCMVFKATFNNLSVISFISSVNYQYYCSFYPDTTKSVVLLIAQSWETTEEKLFIPFLKSFVQPPAPKVDALPLHHRGSQNIITLVCVINN